MLKIRRSRDRLIFNIGIPIHGKDGLCIRTGSWIVYMSPDIKFQVTVYGMQIATIPIGNEQRHFTIHLNKDCSGIYPLRVIQLYFGRN